MEKFSSIWTPSFQQIQSGDVNTKRRLVFMNFANEHLVTSVMIRISAYPAIVQRTIRGVAGDKPPLICIENILSALFSLKEQAKVLNFWENREAISFLMAILRALSILFKVLQQLFLTNLLFYSVTKRLHKAQFVNMLCYENQIWL